MEIHHPISLFKVKITYSLQSSLLYIACDILLSEECIHLSAPIFICGVH